MNNKRMQTSTYRLTLGLLALGAILTACPGKEPPPNTTETPSLQASLAPIVEPTPDPNFNPPDQPEPEPETPVNPGNVKAKYLSDESFELTWEPVEGALAYFILNAKGDDAEDIEILGDEIEEPKFIVNKATLTTPMVILVGSLNEAGRSANVTELKVDLASLKPADGTPADQAQASAVPQAPIPDPLPSPTPTPTLSPSASTSTSSSATPTPTPTPTATATATATPTPTPTPTATATATATPTPTPTPTATATPTPTPTPTPTATPQSLGNGYLGYVGTTSTMDSISGIDVKNNIIATGYLVDGITSNERKVRQINLSNGSNTEYTTYSTFTGIDGLISGVSISSTGNIWSSLKQPNSDGYNLYAHQSNGTLVTRYKIPGSGLVIEDIAVDGNLVYIASPNNNSVMRYNASDTSSNALTVLFTGATAINPAGVALDSSGNLYTADVMTGKLIKFSKSDGSRLLEFDGKGVNGTGQTFTAIGDLAVDPRNGDMYVIAVSGSSPRIYRYTSAGHFVHSFTSSEMVDPDKITIGSNGHIYVTDANKKAILAFDAGQ